jgi:hypothetical protein
MGTIATEGLDGYPSPGDITELEGLIKYTNIDSPEAAKKLGNLSARTAFEEFSIAMCDIGGIGPGSPTARTSVTAPRTIWHNPKETDKMSDPDTRGSD